MNKITNKLQNEVFESFTEEIISKINNEFIKEKENFLKEMNNNEKEQSQKYIELQSNMQTLLEKQDYKLELYHMKIENLFQQVWKNSSEYEKLPNISKKQEELSDDIFSLNRKLTTLNTELNNHQNKFNKFMLDNILIPGVVGKDGKFQTLADFVRVYYLLT